jgi:hypothetical protein
MPRVNDLVLVAAPSCCGKTRFLEELYGGRLQDLVLDMELDTPISRYVSMTPVELRNHRATTIARLMLHFAIPTIPLNDGSLQDLAKDPRLDVVKSANRVTVITLFSSANVLVSRVQLRYRANRRRIFTKFTGYLSERRRLAKLKKLYAAPDKLVFVYEAWLHYVNSLPNLYGAWLVAAESEYEAFRPSEWERIKGLHFQVSTRTNAVGVPQYHSSG